MESIDKKDFVFIIFGLSVVLGIAFFYFSNEDSSVAEKLNRDRNTNNSYNPALKNN